MFNEYPYRNLTDLNLDYILNAIKTFQNEVTNFVSINAIKYANPIQWNITSQYEKNTIVIDPLTGTAYISVAPVPSGVALTREEYWTVVFDLGSFVVRAAKNFTDRYEADTTLTATFPTAAGDWLVWGDTLYRAAVNITAGDQYVIGSNIVHFTMETETKDIKNLIGLLSDLDTTDKTSVVAAINEVLATLTETTTRLDDAISDEAEARAQADEALNEIIRPYTNSKPINALTLGIDNTGVEDCTAIINEALEHNSLYFPYGRYKITSPIYAKHNIIGAGNYNGAGEPSGLAPDRTAFISDSTFAGNAMIIIDGTRPVILRNFCLLIRDAENGIDVTPTTERLFNEIDDVSIVNISSKGINVAPTLTTSKPVYIHNCRLWGKQYAASTGIYLASTAPDCIINNTWIMGIRHGIENLSGILIMANNHIWCGPYSFTDNNDWWSGTVGIISSGRVTATNLYIDSPLVAFSGNYTGEVHVSNLVLWFDTSMTGSNRYDASIGYRFDRGKIIIDNGYIRVTDRMQYIFDNRRLISNNVVVIIDNDAVIQNKPLVFPILKENNDMYLPALGGTQTYQEVAHAYIPNFGNFTIEVNDTYINIAELKVSKGTGGISVRQYNRSGSSTFAYSFTDNHFVLYRRTADQYTNVNVRLKNCSAGALVYNYNLIRTVNNNDYARSELADATTLTTITATQLIRTDWAQYGATFTIPANSTLNVTIPLYANEQTGFATGIPSIIIDDLNVSLDTYQYNPSTNTITGRARNHSSSSVTTPITVFVAFAKNNI